MILVNTIIWVLKICKSFPQTSPRCPHNTCTLWWLDCKCDEDYPDVKCSLVDPLIAYKITRHHSNCSASVKSLTLCNLYKLIKLKWLSSVVWPRVWWQGLGRYTRTVLVLLSWQWSWMRIFPWPPSRFGWQTVSGLCRGLIWAIGEYNTVVEGGCH